MTFGFIIPTCCREDIHLRQLLRCISSIRKYYPNKDIILINDSNDNYNIVNEFVNDTNIHIIKSYNKGSADQQIFKVLLKTDLFNKAVFMQDSMLLNKKLEGIDEILDIKFIWHFTNHRVHWNIIKEPITQFNKNNNIISHTDLIRYHILTNYNDNKDFQKFALNKLQKMNEWCGSIGSCCIITKSALTYMNNYVNFIDKFIDYNSNRLRRVNESVFPLICYYCYQNIKFEDSYDGLYYDGMNHGGVTHLRNKPTEFDNLQWCAVHEFFSKISFNR